MHNSGAPTCTDNACNPTQNTTQQAPRAAVQCPNNIHTCWSAYVLESSTAGPQALTSPSGTVASQHRHSNRQQLSANMPQAAFQQWHEKLAGPSSFRTASPGAHMLICTLALPSVLHACNHLDTWLGLGYGEQTYTGATGPRTLTAERTARLQHTSCQAVVSTTKPLRGAPIAGRQCARTTSHHSTFTPRDTRMCIQVRKHIAVPACVLARNIYGAGE